jgi:hypothetical protein
MAVKSSGASGAHNKSTAASAHLDANYLCMCSDGKSVTINPGHLAVYSGYFSSLLHSDMKETRTRSVFSLFFFS